MLRDNRHSSNSLNSFYFKIDSPEDDHLDEDTKGIKKSIPESTSNNSVYSFFNPRIKRFLTKPSLMYLLNVLFSLLGLLLFIYGLFGKHLLQFIISFIFLAPGLFLDNARE